MPSDRPKNDILQGTLTLLVLRALDSAHASRGRDISRAHRAHGGVHPCPPSRACGSGGDAAIGVSHGQRCHVAVCRQSSTAPKQEYCA